MGTITPQNSKKHTNVKEIFIFQETIAACLKSLATSIQTVIVDMKTRFIELKMSTLCFETKSNNDAISQSYKVKKKKKNATTTTLREEGQHTSVNSQQQKMI